MPLPMARARMALVMSTGVLALLPFTAAPVRAATYFTSPPVNFTTGPSPAAVALDDLDGDGKLDPVVANSGSANGIAGVSVFENTTAVDTGPPTFAAPLNLNTGPAPADVASGDLNGDGPPDLVVANGGSDGANGVTVLLSTAGYGATTPSFSSAVSFATGPNPSSVALGDINRDGKPDIVTANKGSATGANGVSVLLNTTPVGAATPSFRDAVGFTAGANPAGVELGNINQDFNGAGEAKLDVVVANSGSATGTNGVSVLLNTTADAETVPAFATTANFTSGPNPTAIALADFNDTTPTTMDIATANSGSTGANGVSVLLSTTAQNAATATFSGPTNFATGANPTSVAPVLNVELDSTNKYDLVTANSGSATGTNGISSLIDTTPTNAATPTFNAPANLNSGAANPGAVAVGDLTGDGPREIVVANTGSASGTDGLSALVYSLPPSGQTSAPCPGTPPPTTQTSWSSSNQTVAIRKDYRPQTYATRATATSPAGTLYDQSTPNPPGSPEADALIAAAQAAMQQAYGTSATYSGPALETSSTPGPERSAGQFLHLSSTAVAEAGGTVTAQAFPGPATYSLGKDQTVDVFVPPNCTDINRHQQFVRFGFNVFSTTDNNAATYTLTATPNPPVVDPPVVKPPIINPPVVKPPVVEKIPKADQAIKLPENKKCVSRNVVSIKFVRPANSPVVKRIEVFLDKKRVKVTNGFVKSATVDLRKLPTKKFTFTAKITYASGKTLQSKRTYTPCSKKKKKKPKK